MITVHDVTDRVIRSLKLQGQPDPALVIYLPPEQRSLSPDTIYQLYDRLDHGVIGRLRSHLSESLVQTITAVVWEAVYTDRLDLQTMPLIRHIFAQGLDPADAEDIFCRVMAKFSSLNEIRVFTFE